MSTRRMERNVHKPTMTPTIRDLYWAAGFLEGEGTFHVGNPRDTSGRVSACQKEPDTLYQLQRLFGGTVVYRSRTTTAFGVSSIYEWRLYGPRAFGVMQTLYSLMSPRRRGQIKAVITNTLSKLEWKTDRPCRYCGQTFLPTRRISKYCSKRCCFLACLARKRAA